MKIIIFGITIIIKIMKKNIVNLEIAKALKELGYTPKEVTPYYFKELLYLNMFVEDWDIKSFSTMFIPIQDVVNVDDDPYHVGAIPAPTVHEALEWFENKGERYMIKVELNDYVAEVMQEGTFIPIGKYKSRKEAEESIMKFYIRTGIEEKIYKLEALTKI